MALWTVEMMADLMGEHLAGSMEALMAVLMGACSADSKAAGWVAMTDAMWVDPTAASTDSS